MINIQLKVTPQSKVNQVEECHVIDPDHYQMKVRVTAPAHEGKANQAVIKLLADYFDVPKSRIEVASGQSSRQKRIVIR